MNSPYLAHSENDKGRAQTLVEHLNGVARRAAKFAGKFGAADEAYVAGLLHDLGKFREEFQKYLRKQRGGGEDTHHSIYGAALAFRRNWLSSFAIAGHHAGLHDIHKLQELLEDEGRYKIAERLPYLENLFKEQVTSIPVSISLPAYCQRDELSSEFYIRMLFSCLVDADYLDTEVHYSGSNRKSINLSQVCELLLERIIAERMCKSSEGRVNRIRHAVFDKCVAAARSKRGFYSLTVPTGGGKTISSMAFALAHAREWNLDRIIVVIPYLSIIEQNASEYRRILDPENLGLVVEHHSAVPIHEDDSRTESNSLDRSCENWDAPIIITTSVQFIETLFSSYPSKCRKLHNICNSIVILDEVQTLPVHLLNPFLSIAKELTQNYSVSFLFMTATQPAFRNHPIFLSEGFVIDEVTEICENLPEVFSVLRRVEYSIEEQIDWQTLAERIAQNQQALCIVNVRKHAFALWEALRELVPSQNRHSVYHLSSAMCPEHRLNVLGEHASPKVGTVRHCLQSGLPCWLVATQLVEAGVDLDFPTVFRAMGPLDSIVQAAGRCNREGKLLDSKRVPKRGQVVIFSPENDSLPPGIYRAASVHTKTFLNLFDINEIIIHPDVFGDYFSQLFEQASTDHSARGKNTIQDDRRSLRFRAVSKNAVVITDGGIPVVVPYENGRGLIEDIRNRQSQPGQPRFGYLDLRRLQRFMVNIRLADFQRLESQSMVKRILPNLEIHVLGEGCYHHFLGVLIENRPLEDFIQ